MCTKRQGAIRCTSSVFTRTLKALSAHKHFIFDAVETHFRNGYNRKTGIFTALQIFWTIHAAGVPFMLVPVAHTKKRQQCWHKMGLQKGQYMQIQKSKMMKILPRVLWFWLIQRDINFKSFVQWQAKVRFSAPTPLWKHLFRGIGMLSWFLTAYATLYVEN